MESTLTRAGLLHGIARAYVEKGLGRKNFDEIPYADQVVLRAPLCPGGSAAPLKGRENLRNQWWSPLPSLLGDVKFIDSYINRDETAVTVEFHCEILNPSCTLRVIDRFYINEAGLITDQEVFYDPRAVTNP